MNDRILRAHNSNLLRCNDTSWGLTLVDHVQNPNDMHGKGHLCTCATYTAHTTDRTYMSLLIPTCENSQRRYSLQN